MLWKILVALITGYTLIPTLLCRTLHLGVRNHGQKGGRKIALTFDDGPDSRYTPRVLEILARYNVKACFFIVGSKASRHPEIIHQVVSAGHQIGYHGYRHSLTWLLSPRATARELTETTRVIENVTGIKPAYFRPPWGIFNAISLFPHWRNHLPMVLWSFMCWDWSKNATAQKITTRALQKVKDGSILIFHDGTGNPGTSEQAPEQMLIALPEILEGLKERNLQPVALGELLQPVKPAFSIVRKSVLLLWGLWEKTFNKLCGVTAIGQPGENIFRLAVHRYRGPEIILPDGTVLQRGDPVGELHLDNKLLMELNHRTQSIEGLAVHFLRKTQHSLPLLASLAANNPAYRSLKAYQGITLIHRGAGRLGFCLIELPPFLNAICTWYLRWLLLVFHPDGLKHIIQYHHKLIPKRIIITRNELLKRYLV